jgi:DNA-binding transcriptional MerR regulator
MEEKELSASELFQIGEVAKLFHISVGSLRHYEQAGLLKPQHIDPDSGYRYYSTQQFEALNTIRYLRVLDMPLDQIAEFLQNRDIDVIEEKMVRQKQAVIEKQRELKNIEQKIDHRLRQLHDARNAELDVVRVEDVPACRLVLMRDSLKPRGWLDLENPIRKLAAGQKTPIVFLGKVGVGISKENLTAGHFDQYDYIFLLLDEEDSYEGRAEIFPAGKCAALRFCGSHSEAPAYYQRLAAYAAEQSLSITGFSREITMIDYGITNDRSKFVTEIRIPVAKK